MASRTFNNNLLHLEHQVVELYIKFTVAATSLAAASTRMKGVTSVTVGGSGEYAVVLADYYPRLLGASFTIERATACEYQMQITAVDTTAGTLTLQFTTNGSAAVLVAGDVVRIVLKLGNDQ
jgi:hypothetical protein